MATERQALGEWGEIIVAKRCACPHCKRQNCLKRLPPNFKCADLICDFCGFLAQVKASKVRSVDTLPKRILGAAWGPQEARMKAAIYFPLYLALKGPGKADAAIWYLSADLQEPQMFLPRKELSVTAKRAGWKGFYYDLQPVSDRFVRLL